MRQLVEVVPQLRQVIQLVGAKEDTIGKREELVRWVREEIAHYTAHARPMRSDDRFLADLTVQEYFALPEEERERIWDELYTAALEAVEEKNDLK